MQHHCAVTLRLLLSAGSAVGGRGPLPSVVHPQGYDIIFAAPENEPDKWDFLLFSPSTLHTAALCIQRCGLGGSGADGTSSTADWQGGRSIERESCPAPGEGSTSLSSNAVESTCGFASNTDALDGSLPNAVIAHSRGAVYRAEMLSLHCWRTVPLSHDVAMDQNDCCVLGSSRLSS